MQLQEGPVQDTKAQNKSLCNVPKLATYMLVLLIYLIPTQTINLGKTVKLKGNERNTS